MHWATRLPSKNNGPTTSSGGQTTEAKASLCGAPFFMPPAEKKVFSRPIIQIKALNIREMRDPHGLWLFGLWARIPKGKASLSSFGSPKDPDKVVYVGKGSMENGLK
jgi:hypothetical protein